MCRALIGPLGGGREKCAVYDILLRSFTGTQRRWRWLVVRADQAGLEEQTIPAWHAVVPEELGEWDARGGRHRFGGNFNGQPRDIEIVFLALDRPEHRRRLMTLEASGVWLDAARDIDEQTFERCLEIAGSWPVDEAPTPLIVATSLMPPADHWLALNPEVRLFRQPGGRSDEAENMAPRGTLAAGHYRRLAAGRSAEWVRVMVDAEWAGQAGTPEEISARLAELKRSREKFYQCYPDEGPLRRELYPKHMEFFAAGKIHQERAFVGANRSGKTFCNCYEAVCHLTGLYEEWWPGRRFNRPVITWAAGEDGKAVRESLQVLLLGSADAYGTGLIPGDKIGPLGSARGMAEAIDFANVTHVSGASSRLLFKTYEQGRESFQAARVDHMLFDEEPPRGIYSEGLTRTMSTTPGEPNGIVTCGFTPLKGISETVLHFMPGGQIPQTEELRRVAWGW